MKALTRSSMIAIVFLATAMAFADEPYERVWPDGLQGQSSGATLGNGVIGGSRGAGEIRVADGPTGADSSVVAGTGEGGAVGGDSGPTEALGSDGATGIDGPPGVDRGGMVGWNDETGSGTGLRITMLNENIWQISLPDGRSIQVILAAGTDMSAFTSGGAISKDNALSIIQGAANLAICMAGSSIEWRIGMLDEVIAMIENIILPPEVFGTFQLGGQPPFNLTDPQNEQNNVNTLNRNTISATELLINELTPVPPSNNGAAPGITPVEEPLVFVEVNSNEGWKWGVWQTPDATPVNVEFFSIAPYQKFSGDDVLNAIECNPGGYNLTGSGDAAAVVKDGANTYLLSGDCNVSLTIGVVGCGSEWSVDTMGGINDGQGHNLDFSIYGFVDPSTGILQGAFTSYTLNADGTYNLSTIQSSTIQANVIGVNPNQPDGLIGSFDVTHTSGPTVQGGFAGMQ